MAPAKSGKCVFRAKRNMKPMDKSLDFGAQRIECTLRTRPSLCVCVDSPYPGKTCEKCNSRGAARINSRQMALCTRSRIVVCIYNALLPLRGRRCIPDTELLRPTRKLKSRKWILVVAIINQFNAPISTFKVKRTLYSTCAEAKHSAASTTYTTVSDCERLSLALV